MADSVGFDKTSNYYSNHQISESRMQRMMGSDKAEATHMGLWDKFKDLFRTDKKEDALNALYGALHGESADAKLDAFDLLKSSAGPAYQDRFVKDIDDDGNILFFIDDTRIGSCSVRQAIHVNEDVRLLPMDAKEKALFVKMLDSLREKEISLPGEGRAGERRSEMQRELKNDVYGLYRPGELEKEKSNIAENKMPEWKGPEWVAEDGSTHKVDVAPEGALGFLNAGTFQASTQFNKIGYRETGAGEVEFTMVHPMISYLLGAYASVENPDMADIMQDTRSKFMEAFNVDYSCYTVGEKKNIDSALKSIYEAHGNTLQIQESGASRNTLTLLD